MRVVAAACAAVVCLSLTHEALAADPADSTVAIGADLQAIIPVGDLSDATSFMIGPLVRGGYRVIPQLELTGRLGYIHGFGAESAPNFSSSLGVIPIWAGARYFFQEGERPAGAYAGGELGINILRSSVSYDGPTVPGAPTISGSDTEARVGLNLSGGYIISRELPIDLRGQLSFLNLFDGDTTLIGIGVSAGYSFFVL